MRYLEYTGRRPGQPREIPDRENLEALLRQNRHQELIRRILEWKGEAEYEYFQTRWDLRPDEIQHAAESLEDVEIKNVNMT